MLAHAEELAATNRELAATIAALEEAKRELTEMEARTRLTTEMMPAHIAHVGCATGATPIPTAACRRSCPAGRADPRAAHRARCWAPQAYRARSRPLSRGALQGGQQRSSNSPTTLSSRRIRAAFTPDPREPGVYILSMDVTEETQARAALPQTRRREMAAQLTSGLAHDFSNLLTIILGMQAGSTAWDLARGSAADRRDDAGAARRGGTLLDRIADITGQRACGPNPTDLGQFLADLDTLASPALPEGIALSRLLRRRYGPVDARSGAAAGFAPEPDPERPRCLRRHRARSR